MEERCRGPVARNQTVGEIIVSFRGNQMPISRNANLTFEIKFPQKSGDDAILRHLLVDILSGTKNFHVDLNDRSNLHLLNINLEIQGASCETRVSLSRWTSLQSTAEFLMRFVLQIIPDDIHSYTSAQFKYIIQIQHTVSDSLCLANCYRWESSIH